MNMSVLFKRAGHWERLRLVTSLFLRRNFASISNLQIANDKKTVAVEFDGKARHVYHAVWLKHLCHCLKCRDPSSGQTQHPPEFIRGSYKLSSVAEEGDNVTVSWEDDEDTDHRGTFPVEWLKENAYGKDVLNKLSSEARPIPLTGKVSEFDYNELVENASKRLDWLLKIYEDGLSILKNVPIESQYVMKVASFVYSNQPSIYGEYFDVVSSPKNTDVAYAQVPLPLHMDQPYYESPPGLQLLHCLKNDQCVEGGFNEVVDVFVAAEEFRRDFTTEFNTLSKTPVIMGRVYKDLDRSVRMLYFRPHFVLGYNNEIVGVHWTNSMQYGLCATHNMVEPYYHARSKWANYVKNFKIRHTIRLTPGDLLIFNNRRVLHSRTDFSLNGGERHLQGTYVNIDEFKSEVLAQCALQGRPMPKTRVGNNDYVC